ncbi:MAG: protein-tyrosine phosphatase [Polaribacter sp.]|jgi:protein-tyrosine phosphatase
MKVLMVCLGNICRSPLAEGILKNKVKSKSLGWTVDSAGTGAWHTGELPDHRSIKQAKENGIDITDQRARQFIASDFQNFDLILAMDSSNYQDILRKATTEEEKKKVAMIMNFDAPGMNENVPDPYWGSDGFGLVYNMLDRACEQIAEQYG